MTSNITTLGYLARKSPIDFETALIIDDQLFTTVFATVSIRDGGFTGAKALYVTDRSEEWAGIRINSHPESAGKARVLIDK